MSARRRNVPKKKSDDETKSGNRDKVELKREVGPIGGISFVVGTMIGSGIFLSPKSILRNVGSVGASLCVWAGCRLLATISSLCYIELGLMMKKSGAEYPYLRAAYGDLVAFLFTWMSVLVLVPASFSLAAVGFAEYAIAPFYPGCDPPVVALKCAACIAILLITTLNCYSVKASNFMQIIFTVVSLLIILAIVIGGFIQIRNGKTEHLTNAFESISTSASNIALSFYFGLWAYEGWKLNYVIEELKKPNRDLPLCIGVGIGLVTVLYLFVNVSYFTVMSPAELLDSNAVATTFGDRVFGQFAWTVPLAVAFSNFGAANGGAFTHLRLAYAAARNGHMIKILSYVSVERFTPSPAAIFTAAISIIMIIPESSTFESLIDYFSFAFCIFYGATFLSVIVLRFRCPKMNRPFKVFIGIPVIYFLCSICLVIAPILDNPGMEYLYAFAFIMAGLIVYFPIIHWKKHPPFMDNITRFLQMLLEVVPPPEYQPDSPMQNGEDTPAAKVFENSFVNQ